MSRPRFSKRAYDRAWRAVDVLHAYTHDDVDPVSMLTTLNGHTGAPVRSVVVLRGPEVVELFRQWAERSGIYHRDLDVDGAPRSPEGSSDG